MAIKQTFANNAHSVEYVFNRFIKHKKDNFNDLGNFINFFKNKDNIKNAINLVIEYTKQLIIRAEEKELIDFMISAKNINLFLDYLPEQTNNINIQNIRNIMQDAKYMITEREQRNSSITGSLSSWSIPSSSESNYSGSNVATATSSTISSSNSSRLWCSTPNSNTKLSHLTTPCSPISSRRL